MKGFSFQGVQVLYYCYITTTTTATTYTTATATTDVQPVETCYGYLFIFQT